MNKKRLIIKSLLVALLGSVVTAQAATCNPTAVTPYIKVAGSWIQTSTATIASGAQIVFGPQPTRGGSWAWSGCGTSGSAREQTVSPTSSCTATTVYTNSCGAKTTQSFSVSITSINGPYSWKNVSVGGGGFVTGVVFSEAENGLVYSRTDVGGAYRWDPVGRQWIQLLNWIGNGQVSLADVESIAPDPRNANRVYIVGGENDITRLMRSNDRGATFELIDPGFKVAGNGEGRGKTERLIVDPHSTNILYYGTRSQGLYKSINSGSNWSKVSGFPVSTTSDGVGITGVIVDPRSATDGTPTKTLYALVSQKGNSLYKSTDSGNTWQVVAGTPNALKPMDAGLDTNGILYISYTVDDGSSGEVWKYDTSNGVWTSITPPTGQGGFGGVGVDKLKPGTLMVATVNRWSPHDEVYRSTNGGISWTRVDDFANRTSSDAPYVRIDPSTVPGNNWIFNLRIDPFNSARAMYGTGAGLWSSSNVTNIDSSQTSDWTFAVKGIEEGGAYELISPPTGAPLLSVFGDIQGFRHTDLTKSPATGFFQLPGWGTGNGLDFAQNNPNKMVRTFMSGNNGAYSTDNGVNWTQFASKPSNSGNYGDTIALSANGDIAVWSIDIWQQNTPPYYSTNNGNSWTQSNVPGLNASSYTLHSDRVNNKKFYLYNITSGYMHVSTDGGANFTQAGFIQQSGRRFAVNPWKEGEVWVPAYDGLYYSTNSGQSFTHLTNVQEAVSATLGKAAPGSNIATIYIQAKINNVWGFYRSLDQGATWVRINDDQHQYGYPSSSFLTADQQVFGRVYYSTHCMGIAYGEISQ